jgi:hypothetical protein
LRRRGPLEIISEHAYITWSLDGDTLAVAIALLHHSAIYRRERAIAHTNTGGITQRRRRPRLDRATAVRAGPTPPRERRKRPWKIRAWAPRIKSQAITATDAMLSRQACSSHAALPSQPTAHPRHLRPAPPTAHEARGTSKEDEVFRSEMHGDNMRSQNNRCPVMLRATSLPGHVCARVVLSRHETRRRHVRLRSPLARSLTLRVRASVMGGQEPVLI